MASQRREYDYLRGDGVGKPQGILNAAAKVTVTRSAANKIKFVDLVGMVGRFHQTNGGASAFVVSQSAVPQLLTLEDTAGNPVWNAANANFNANAAGGARQLPPLLGYPVFVTENLPALGTTGDI